MNDMGGDHRHLPTLCGRDIAFVVPFRNDASGSRMRCLQQTLRHLLNTISALQCVVVEIGDAPHASIRCWPPGIETLFVRCTGLFPPSRARNIGARITTRPWIWFCDGDVIMPADVLRDTWACAQHHTAPIKPYTYTVHVPQPYVGRPDIVTWAARNSATWQRHQGSNSNTALTLLLPRCIIPRVGLFEEAFEGWGFEDCEYAIRLHRLGHPLIMRDNTIYHLDHDLPHNAVGKNTDGFLVGSDADPILQRNYRIYRSITALTDDALRQRYASAT